MSGGTNSFPVCIPGYSRTFTFSVEFSVVWEAPLLRAISILFLGAWDRIPHELSFNTCIGWIAPGWKKLLRVFFLCEHISIRLQLKIWWYKLQDNHLLVILCQRLSVRHRNWQLLVFAHHKTLRLGVLFWVTILFIPWKALFCSFDHWNSVSFRRNSLIGSVTVARLGMNFS